MATRMQFSGMNGYTFLNEVLKQNLKSREPVVMGTVWGDMEFNAFDFSSEPPAYVLGAGKGGLMEGITSIGGQPFDKRAFLRKQTAEEFTHDRFVVQHMFQTFDPSRAIAELSASDPEFKVEMRPTRTFLDTFRFR